MLAYKKDGQYLSVLNNGEGPLRLIISGQPAEKCLKNVVSITVQ
jgi:DMSO/TMAO reductase YedYZ molybdopterin-dependent catalytic subunit